MTRAFARVAGRSRPAGISLQLLAALAVGLAPATLPARTVRTVERIVAVVNDGIILQSELHGRIRPLMQQLKSIADKTQRQQRLQELRHQALEHMINEQLITQEARKLKVSVDDRELERAVADVMHKNSLTREQLEEALAREGKSIAAYKATILRPQLLRLKVLNATVRARVSVDEAEIRTAYNKSMRDLGVETKVRASHIFIAIPAGADEARVAERRRHAEALLGRLKQDSQLDFGELARQVSEDSATRGDGGDLGFFGRGTLPANVENVLFSLRRGEVRGPLRTARGFHLVQLTDRRASSARPYAEVKEQLKQQIYQDKLEKATEAWLKEVRKRSHVVVKLRPGS